MGAGTDPTEGAALGRAILDELDNLRCRAMVTTHLGYLKTYAFHNERAENGAVQFDVETLAARAYMSRRTFDRRFRSLTGSAPLQWLITQRVLQAQRLLETSDYSVDEVAGRCGFRSPVALRGHFRRQLGSSPAAYRAAYRIRRPEGANGGNGHGDDPQHVYTVRFDAAQLWGDGIGDPNASVYVDAWEPYLEPAGG